MKKRIQELEERLVQQEEKTQTMEEIKKVFEGLSLRGGATAYLDTNAYANDETIQFLGRMFRNSPVIEFPANSFGLRLGIAPLNSSTLNWNC